jgi:hypothetical protein
VVKVQRNAAEGLGVSPAFEIPLNPPLSKGDWGGVGDQGVEVRPETLLVGIAHLAMLVVGM